MDALTLLKEDHDRVKKMLADGEKTTERGEKTRAELFERLKESLVAHESMEEQVLYPALKANPKAKELTLEAYEEHHVVDLVLEELEQTPVSDEQWGAKFTVAKENIEHHIDEEEGEMFKICREIFSREELDQMGAQMAEIQMGAKQVLSEEASTQSQR
jgi:hemerythrin-like domain-containing protein